MTRLDKLRLVDIDCLPGGRVFPGLVAKVIKISALKAVIAIHVRRNSHSAYGPAQGQAG